MPILLSASEAAARLGCAASTVRRRAAQHDIGQRVAGVRVFAPRDLARLREVVRPGPGNPQFGPGYAGRWPAAGPSL